MCISNLKEITNHFFEMKIEYLKPTADTVMLVPVRFIATSTDSILAPSIGEDDDTDFASF